MQVTAMSSTPDSFSAEVRLASRVERAFESSVVPSLDASVTQSRSHHESERVELQFRGRPWQAISFAEVSQFRMVLPLLTAVYFRHLLPAFIVRSLRHRGPEDDALEFVYFSLIPPQDGGSRDYDEFVDRMSAFDGRQRTAIGEVVHFASNGFVPDEDGKARARAYWAVTDS